MPLAPRARTRVAVAVMTLLLLLAAVPAAADGRTPVGDRVTADQAAALQQWRSGLAAGPSDAAGTGEEDVAVVPGSLLVTTTEGAEPLVRSFAGNLGSVTSLAPGITAVAVDPGEEATAAAALRASPGVLSVEPNRIRAFTAIPDDALYPEQWAHQVTGIEGAWEVSTGSREVLIALADSGVVAAHPDLGGIVEQVDASTGRILPGSQDNDPCRVGHGTWVAGVVGAVGDNGIGVAGVNWDVSILDINTADPAVSCNGPTDAGTIAAIRYAADRGADVVNLSLSAPERSCPAALQAAIDQARAAGTLVVAAAGNAGDRMPQVPASCNGAISVGATGADNRLARYSVTNPWVDLVAPGGGAAGGGLATEVATTGWWNSGSRSPEYVGIAGTSFSTPYVSGIAGLMRAVDPTLSVEDLESLLQSTALDLGEPGRDDAFGFGLVQGEAVLRAAAGGVIPPPQPGPDFPVEGSAGPGPRPGGPVAINRVWAGSGVTEPITQAVAVSRSVFTAAGGSSGVGVGARWGVVARSDDYADALAGASLTLGVAPLLFTPSSGSLAPPTAEELQRTLPPGATVYLLGGPAALPASLDDEIATLGLVPVRLAGPVREATAVRIADELDALLTEIGIGPSSAAILVNREDWPDAIAAGQVGGQFGVPVLLTPADQLAAETADALRARDLQVLYVIGGTVRISDDTQQAAVAQAGLVQATRLAGEERNGTVIAVSSAVEQILASTPQGAATNALVVNVRRDDGYAHMLAATMPLGTFAGLFLPVEDDGGTAVAGVTRDYAAGLGLDLSLMGGPDLIADTAAAELQRIASDATATTTPG
ncbi:hypothetical protein BH23ACT9_BH23ACT9_39170 [soil metagenome]